ncbi:MAG: acyl-ACP--UDP-N-acetylglucosamine O-acyltransferase [Bryobacterales bacterium]|nr:acyl-ACP--UDP-N-acetylglucosamine O-acyltransferase [Bryobacterales bacterium]
MPIHSTAIVDPRASIHPEADIGPYCILQGEVVIGARTRLMAHAFLEGPLTVGEDNTFFPYCSIGAAPQDMKYKGERSETRIGNGNRIREFVTIHRGTEGGGLVTSLGDGNLLLAYVHVAHDCALGSHNILSNGATLAGHVVVGDWVVLGGLSAVHQFCRVGSHSIVGGGSIVTQDVAPYSMTVAPREAKLFGVNKVGLQRRGFSGDAINALHRTFRLLGSKTLNTSQALEKIRAEVPQTAEVAEVIGFIERSTRGVIK